MQDKNNLKEQQNKKTNQENTAQDNKDKKSTAEAKNKENKKIHSKENDKNKGKTISLREAYENLKRELSIKHEELKKIKEAILYEKADFENYRKRVIKEKSDLAIFTTKDILLNFLPIRDNLERALEHTENCSKETLAEGLKMTLALFKEAFAKFQVNEIDSKGKPFNPELQEAMSREANNELEENTVIQEYIKGYTIGDKLLRPAQVAVSYKPENEEKEQTISKKPENTQ